MWKAWCEASCSEAGGAQVMGPWRALGLTPSASARGLTSEGRPGPSGADRKLQCPSLRRYPVLKFACTFPATPPDPPAHALSPCLTASCDA